MTHPIHINLKMLWMLKSNAVQHICWKPSLLPKDTFLQHQHSEFKIIYAITTTDDVGLLYIIFIIFLFPKVIKNKNIAILVVDGHTTEPVSGKIGATSTDTKNPLFLGSQPFVTRRRGGAVDEKYVGCMRNISVNKENIALAYATYVGNVNSGTCPTIWGPSGSGVNQPVTVLM